MLTNSLKMIYVDECEPIGGKIVTKLEGHSRNYSKKIYNFIRNHFLKTSYLEIEIQGT